MGYLIMITIEEIKWDEDKITELYKEIEAMKKKEEQEEWERELLYLIDFTEHLECIDEEKQLYKLKTLPVLVEYDPSSWRHDEEWMKFLAKYIKKGKIMFSGEEQGDVWAYQIDDGKLFKIFYELVESKRVQIN